MKIEEQVLSREQMAHLEKLGVDTSDASMAYYNISRENEPDKWLLGIANTTIATTMLVNGFEKMQPTYTIGDLIYKVNNLFKNFSFTDNRQINILYDCIRWMAENHKELIK